MPLLFMLGAVFVVTVICVIAIVFDFRMPRARVEKQPTGFTSNKRMVFRDEGDKPFKEGWSYGKQGIYLKKDWNKDEPSFYARPDLDYLLGYMDGDDEVYYSRLNKDGDGVIQQEEWNRAFEINSGEAQYSEQWFEKEREKNVRKNRKDEKHKTPELKESIRRDGAFSDAILKQKQWSALMGFYSGYGKKRRALPPLPEGVEEGE